MGNGTKQRALGIVIALAALGACAHAVEDSDDTSGGPKPPVESSDSGTSRPDGGAAKDSGRADPDSGVTPLDDASAEAAADAAVPLLVYGHTSDTLYTFDPKSSTLSMVGTFQNCSQNQVPLVIDLAVDEKGNAFVTTFDGFYSLDLTTAQCTLVAKGGYPNSLSFVPKGTLDPNEEALVGYTGATYVRVDTKTGAIQTIGALANGYASSGDVVSVKGGGTFLTVTGNGCADCVLQVDPATGAVVQNYGSLGRGSVFGLGYWAGTLYGFNEAGELFAITGGNGVTANTVTISTNAQVKWWGAGSTTSAPVKDPDGGVISTL
jgi:hypothetical protein